ncbi:MAG: OmpA family protein [Cyclobacteriaceae bacterium]|nr:MAG: OmpA family protein [Cyclobacteriaceae bacterium]
MKKHFLIFLPAFLLLLSLPATGQKPDRKFKKGGVVQLNDTLTTYSQSDIFNFPNINNVSFYSDKKSLEKIAAIPKDNGNQTHYNLLKAYVQQFGVENFSRNTNMLWQLAKLSEKFGPPGEAVLLYKLVLKHHQQDIDGRQVRQEYDSLTKYQSDYYVPLKYYYELVEYRKEIDTLRPPQGVLLNMGIQVNSPKADYGPTIGNVDTVLLFTSKRNLHTQTLERRYDEDLFYSVQEFDMWMDAVPFNTINTSYNEGSACLSKDGKQLYFARCDSPDSKGSCDIFVADRKEDNSWGNVRNLGDNINTVFWDSHPSLSHTGDTLFFSSDRKGGFGMTDIYFSIKDKDGNWQPAKNMGPIINTRGQEVSPFFHHKFNVLYFSSNGHPLNFGDFDIFKTYKQNGNWAEPKNVGPLVNGAGSEYYFTIDSKSEKLYYARSEGDDPANLDLHSFPVPMEAQPEAIATLKGSLTNSQTGKPMKGIVSIIDLDKGVEVAPKFLRPDGTFDFKLINKRNYLLIIQGDDFFRIEEIFFMDGDMEINKETEPIESKIAFKSLEFESGKADILSSMHEDLSKLGNFMLDHPHIDLTISGHTDSEGKPEANLRLSQERADAIKAYLVYEYKVPSSRITAIGYGGSKPIVEEKTDDDRRLNRRVEFEIKNKID